MGAERHTRKARQGFEDETTCVSRGQTGGGVSGPEQVRGHWASSVAQRLRVGR